MDSRRNVFACALIDEVGKQQLVERLKLKHVETVLNWRRRGIPSHYLCWLKEAYPHLRAWTLAPAQEAPK